MPKLPESLALPVALVRKTGVVRDMMVMVARSVRLTSRNLEALLTSVVMPLLMMLVFVYLFGGAIQTSHDEYVTYALPGVLVLAAGFVSALTAVSVTQDVREGIVDRFRSMDVSGASVLAGHVAASVVRNVSSAVIMIGVAMAVGFRSTATAVEWVAAIGMLLLFVLAISWLAAAFGLIAKTPEGAGAFQFFIMFLPYPSSAFVPIATMPIWLHGFADNQPTTPVIETMRGLLVGTPVGNSAWLAIAWCIGIMAALVTLAAVLFRLRTR
jgi:ABC-2 type transport system permease protein